MTDNEKPNPVYNLLRSGREALIAKHKAEIAAERALSDLLAKALEPFVEGAGHTQSFFRTRNKMHPVSQELYAKDVDKAEAALCAYEKARDI